MSSPRDVSPPSQTANFKAANSEQAAQLDAGLSALPCEGNPSTNELSVGAKLSALRARLQELSSVLVCYSGGIDSAFLLAVAAEELGQHAIGMTAISASLPESERLDAARVAEKLGAIHRFVASNEIARPGYVKNAPDRCFHCKTELYEIAEQKRIEWGLNWVLNGTNQSDLGDYRPGLEAAKNSNVLSPLVELGFTKQDIRDAAQSIGMDIWDKPAAACLSSRIPYGTSVTQERLSQVGGLEASLKALGFRQLRVRWHDQIARIEIDLSELSRLLEPGVRDSIVSSGKKHGFAYITLDLAGYRTGSHNEVLVGKSLKLVD